MHTTLRVGSGEQNFKWLAFAVRNLYAMRHPAYDTEQFTPVLVCDSDRRPLFPQSVISECVSDGDDIFVDLIGPTASLHDAARARERSLWEQYAHNPPSMFVSTTFFFDASGMTDLQGETVGIFGNFNAWSVPIPMRPIDKHVFELTFELPVGAEICFKFVLNDKHVTSNHYPVIQDENGVFMNYVRVKIPAIPLLTPSESDPSVFVPAPPLTATSSRIARAAATAASAELPPGLGPQALAQLSSSAPDVADALRGLPHNVDASAAVALGVGLHLASKDWGAAVHGAVAQTITRKPAYARAAGTGAVKTLSVRVTGVFEGVQRLSHDMQRRLLESDWTNIRCSDVVRTPEEREAVKAVLWHHSEELRLAFRSYSTLAQESDVSVLAMVTFAHVMHLCGVTDTLISAAKLYRVTNRALLDEEEAMAAAAAARAGASAVNRRVVAVTTAKTDPFHPDTHFTRAGFYEAMIRLAVAQRPQLAPADALAGLLRDNVLPHALRAAAHASHGGPDAPVGAIHVSAGHSGPSAAAAAATAAGAAAAAGLPAVPETDVSQRMLASKVQKVFAANSSRLWPLFVRFASVRERGEKKGLGARTVTSREYEAILHEYKLCDQYLSRRQALTAFAQSARSAAAAAAAAAAGAAAAALAGAPEAAAGGASPVVGTASLATGSHSATSSAIAAAAASAAAAAADAAALAFAGAPAVTAATSVIGIDLNLEVTYPEFLEVIARLSETRFSGPNPAPTTRAHLDLADKIEVALQRMFPTSASQDN
jgi:hypothetical protein